MPRCAATKSALAAPPLSLCLLTAALLCLAPSATAATKTWTDGSGSWNTSANWTPSGQPQAGDNAYLTQSDSANRTVSLHASTPTLNSLRIDATGTGTVTLYIYDIASMQATTEYIGYSGNGSVNQVLGWNFAGTVYMGYLPGSNGSYTMPEMSAVVMPAGVEIATLYIGYYGSGSFTIDPAKNSNGSISATQVYLGYFSGSSGTMNLANSGYDWNTTGSLYVGGSSTAAGGTGLVSVSNGTWVTVGGTLKIWDTGSLTIQSGARVNAGSLDNSAGGTLNWIDGTVNITGASGLTLGPSGPLGASFQLSAGRTLTVTNTTTVAAGGSLILSGGTLNTDTLTKSGGAFNWTGGTLGITRAGGFAVGSGGLLGDSLVLEAGRALNVTNNLAIASGAAVTLNGGGLSAGSISNSGTLNWASGTLGLTGAGGLIVGAAGPLGASLTLDGNKALKVTNATTVASDGSLTLSGGSLTTGTLAISGGAFNWISGTLGITDSGGFGVGPTGPLGSSLTLDSGKALNVKYTTTIAAGGSLTLSGGTLTTGTLNNSGGVFDWTSGTLSVTSQTGFRVGPDGLLGASVTVDSGQTLICGSNFSVGISGSASLTIRNGGQVSASGFYNYIGSGNGTATVVVEGIGSLCIIATSLQVRNPATITVSNGGSLAAAMITNNGVLTVQSGGVVTVTGDLTNGGSLTVNDAMLSAATITNTGTIRGRGDINGAITNNAGGMVAPEASPGILTVDDITFADGSTLQIELGGLARGTEYDVLAASGAIAFQGDCTLTLSLINGFVPQWHDEFDILDFAGASGHFNVLNLPQLGGGLSWDTSDLYAGGTIVVAPEPATLAMVAMGAAAMIVRRRR